MKQVVHIHGRELRIVQVAIAFAIHMITAVMIAAAVAVSGGRQHRVRRKHAPAFRIALLHARRPVFIPLRVRRRPLFVVVPRNDVNQHDEQAPFHPMIRNAGPHR